MRTELAWSSPETSGRTLQRWHDSDGVLWAVCENDAVESRLELVDFGRFVLNRTSGQITGELSVPLDVASAERRFWKEAVPMLHQANGGLGLHASAVATPSGGVLLVGESGAGKSSLARAWSARPGRSQLADDVSVLYRDADGTYRVHPLPFYTNVWGPIRQRLEAPDLEVTEPVESTPLAALVLVERSESGPEIESVAAAAFATILRESACFSLADDPSRRRFYADNLDLISAVPCRRLRYPHDLETLPDTLDLLDRMTITETRPGRPKG